MPTSATGRRERPRAPAARRGARGLSLIELLVVVAIVAVLAGVALLAVASADAARGAEREARRIAALVDLACRRAELTGRPVGLHVAARAIAFSSADGAGWAFEPGGDLRQRRLGDDAALDLEVDGRALELGPELPLEPQALCTPSGELTPFVLGVAHGGVARRALAGRADTRVELLDAGG